MATNKGITADQMRAYILSVHQEAAGLTDRIGSAETESLNDGRCYECGLRGHTHFTCMAEPETLQEWQHRQAHPPNIRRLIPYDCAPIMGPWEDQ